MIKPLSKINKDFLTDIMKASNYYNSIGNRVERLMYYEDIFIFKEMTNKELIQSLKKEISNQNTTFYSALALKIRQDLEE